MERKNYKLVRNDRYNSDQYLVGFYETEDAAQKARLNVLKEHPNWINSRDGLVVKRVNPDMILNPVATDYSHYIGSLIPDDEWKRVMQNDASAEIDINNCCCGFGGRTYYYLSKMIPKDWTVIDIGASYGAQSYLFQSHSKYIAVEPFKSDGWHFENFKANGTWRYEMTAGEFIKEMLPKLKLDLNKTFAIANYTPNWFGENPIELVRSHFSNIWTFYPCS